MYIYDYDVWRRMSYYRTIHNTKKFGTYILICLSIITLNTVLKLIAVVTWCVVFNNTSNVQ